MNIYRSKTDKADRQVMRTPGGIAEWCAMKYGCTIDLAADRANRKFHYYFSDVKPVDDEPHDGYAGDALLSPWTIEHHRVGFCNPPYADLEPWILRAANEARLGFTSVFLIPTFNGEDWGATVYAYAREIIFVHGRINFIRPDGTPLRGNGRGSMLAVFGPHHQHAPAFSFIHRDALHP